MDFERVYDRRKDGSIKWNRYSEEVIPLWVADMDFEVAEPIRAAFQRYVDTGIYGYAMPPASLTGTVIAWLKERYGWEVQEEWIVWLPSVLSGLGTAARYVSTGPYAVMTSVPVYRPFLDIAEGEGRTLQAVPLKQEGWTMDFEAMEAAVTSDTRMYILCNPHNPTGRMYGKEELEGLAAFCAKHRILICSDEIHADLILDKSKRHIPIASLSPEIASNTISLFSAAKAFNVPALSSAFAVIPNAAHREGFGKIRLHTVPHMTLLGGEVNRAAYAEAGPWLEAALEYLRKNHDFLLEEINRIPGLKMNPQEATYLAWIDYSDLGINDFAAHLEKYGVGVMEASIFMGKGHIRLNFATQRHVLEEAVKRIGAAVEQL